MVGFLALSRDQLNKFIGRQTGISVQSIVAPNGERDLPVLVFCPKKAYLRTMYPNETQDDYEANFNTNFSVEYKGIFVNDYEYEADDAYDKTYLPTQYHGRCEMFQMNRKVAAREVLAFHWTRNQEAEVYVFQRGN